jgi:transcriptional regulator with XRE-family HTH domain
LTAMRASQAFIYQPSATFPAFLRGAREAAGLSIRQTAAAIGISAAWLSRLETGGSARQPSMDRLRRMAELYNVELHVMMGEAGVVHVRPDHLDLTDHTDARFEALMLNDSLRPAMMSKEALSYFSPRIKRQILEVVEKLCLHPDPAALLNSILQGQGSIPRGQGDPA